MFTVFEARLRAGLTRAARNVLGAICLIVAAAFFTIAAWIGLEPAFGAALSAAMIGGAYLVVGLLFLYLPVRPRLPARTAAAPSTGSLIEAFLAGRAAGQAMRKDS
ncbi:hypothetical protein [Salipiger sp.]|uniref:hypothetical protein n=1 Tax=Salipiger sp. TaxID=2078585 RepID=UPI003A96D834